MTESKIALTERLRREGRWNEASRFKDTKVKELRAGGITGAVAKEEGWRLMAAEFPPLGVAEETADPTAGPQGEAPTPASSEGGLLPSPQAIRVTIPPDWGLLPENVDPRVEVKWVAANLNLCRGRRSNRPDTVDLARATSKAPSWAATGMLEAAVSNPNKFMLEVYPKFVGAEEDDGEAEKIREEKIKIEEIEDCLRKLNQDWAEELIADVPATVRAKVRGILEDWARRFAMTIPAEAKTDLEAHIGGLVQECLAIAPASGGG